VAAFIDTSVLVWLDDDSDAVKQRRAQLRLAAEYESGTPRTNANVLGELYVALTRRRGKGTTIATHDEALAAVQLAARLDVVPVTRDHVLHAVRLRARHQLAFWDALNIASALAHDCTLFLTADLLGARTIEGMRFEDPTAP